MSKIFISYRRSDSPDVTGRIFDHLSSSFGRSQVFKDVDSLPFGVDFRTIITQAVQACDVVIVIIGPGWLKATNSAGDYRLNDASDFVRIEIEGALARDIPTIPVLVSGAKMPAAEALPSSIQPLVFRNAIQVRSDPDFSNDIARLVRALQRVNGNRPVEPVRLPDVRRTLLISVGLAALLVLLLLAGFYFRKQLGDEIHSQANQQSSNEYTPAHSAAADSLVHNLVVSSNKDYRVGKLEEGAAAYFDRSYVFTNIPSFLQGQSYILTANEDKCFDDPAAFNLKFDVHRPVTVYLAHDDRYVRKPPWMSPFEKTKESITLAFPGSRQRYTLYRKEFSPGMILLGSNVDNRCLEGNFAMYSVIIAPADVPSRPTP
jgi:hypothetical protein